MTMECESGSVLEPARRGPTALSSFNRSKCNRQGAVVPAPPDVDFIDLPVFFALALEEAVSFETVKERFRYAAIALASIPSSLSPPCGTYMH